MTLLARRCLHKLVTLTDRITPSVGYTVNAVTRTPHQLVLK
jgi:hypothetical protein